MLHQCEADLVCKCTNEKIPYFNVRSHRSHLALLPFFDLLLLVFYFFLFLRCFFVFACRRRSTWRTRSRLARWTTSLARCSIGSVGSLPPSSSRGLTFLFFFLAALYGEAVGQHERGIVQADPEVLHRPGQAAAALPLPPAAGPCRQARRRCSRPRCPSRWCRQLPRRFARRQRWLPRRLTRRQRWLPRRYNMDKNKIK